MSNQQPKKPHNDLQIAQDLLEVGFVYKNTRQDIIQTTVDKVRLTLYEHQTALAAKTDWIGPLGVVITILATLITTDFRQFLNLSPEVWNALFIFTLIGSVGWLIYNLNKLLKYRNYSVNEFIESLQGIGEE